VVCKASRRVRVFRTLRSWLLRFICVWTIGMYLTTGNVQLNRSPKHFPNIPSQHTKAHQSPLPITAERYDNGLTHLPPLQPWVSACGHRRSRRVHQLRRWEHWKLWLRGEKNPFLRPRCPRVRCQERWTFSGRRKGPRSPQQGLTPWYG